jgi:hypothetical protein
VCGPGRQHIVAVVVGGGDRLGEVPAQVADDSFRPGRAGGEALDVVLVPESHDMGRLGLGVGVERFVPGGEQLAGGRVGVAAFGPDGDPVGVDGVSWGGQQSW